MEDINQEKQMNQESQDHSLEEDHRSKSNDDIYLEWKKYIELRKKAKED